MCGHDMCGCVLMSPHRHNMSVFFISLFKIIIICDIQKRYIINVQAGVKVGLRRQLDKVWR